MFFQIKWWVPCVYPSQTVFFFPSKIGSSEESADEVQMVFFGRDVLGATLLFNQFRCKPGPQQYFGAFFPSYLYHLPLLWTIPFF